MEAEDVKFTVNGKEIEEVSEFRYLGRILSHDDDDTKCIMDNLKRAKNRWNSIAKILKREGANAICMARFYLTVVQAVLLYGADSWTVTERNMKKLDSFHKRAVRYMTGQHIRKVCRGRNEERWEYPEHRILLRTCRLFPLKVYIERRRGTLREYLLKYREEILIEAENTRPHCHAVNKVLWWKQPWMKKKDVHDLAQLWFPQ